MAYIKALGFAKNDKTAEIYSKTVYEISCADEDVSIKLDSLIKNYFFDCVDINYEDNRIENYYRNELFEKMYGINRDGAILKLENLLKNNKVDFKDVAKYYDDVDHIIIDYDIKSDVVNIKAAKDEIGIRVNC